MLRIFTALLLSITASAHARPTVIEENEARYLFKFAQKMHFDDDVPADSNTAELVGGCLFTVKAGVRSLYQCECEVGRILDPSKLLEIVSPHLKLRRFPELDDRKTGTLGYSMRIDYTCIRRPVVFWHEYRCSLQPGY
jgi:hypothetical protein